MVIYQAFIKDFFLDVISELFYFPIWWYSRGLKKTAFFCWRMIRSGWQRLALSIIFFNFFKPMYAQRGWDVYVLSLFSHFWQLFYRLILMASWTLFWILILFAWLSIWPFIIWQLMI